MDLDKIKSLMDRFENSEIRELKLDEGNFHLYLSKNKINQVPVKKTTSTKKDAIEIKKSEPADEKPAVKSPSQTLSAVKAPLVGVVYLQAKPGADPYVKIGDHIQVGETVAIIEAMKMMTEIKSKVSGTVTKINVKNEDLVEVGQPLISVKED